MLSLLRTFVLGVAMFFVVAIVTYFLAKPGPMVVDGDLRRLSPIGAVALGILLGAVAGIATMIADRLIVKRERSRALG